MTPSDATSHAGQPLGAQVVSIDSRMAGLAGITASYLIGAARPCLVETGTALSAPTVLAALTAAGLAATDLATIVVTHIHLDHAGGVGDLAEAFPRARIVVHEAGARHLVDPSRLLASAARVFGPDLDLLFGPLRPVAAERVDVVEGRSEIDLGGGRRLTAFHAPGHATHHLGLLDSDTGDLYVGDAAGVWIPETETLRPATPPPDFDPAAYRATLHRFRDLDPDRLLYSHFGPVTDVGAVLARAEEELNVWVDIVASLPGRAADVDLDHAVERVVELTRAHYADLLAQPEVAAKFERLSPTASNVAGILHWLRRTEAAGSKVDG